MNPWDTRSRIELGLLAEAEGDQATATRYLLQAAEADHLFLPRWTLANYYFRRGDTALFWRWAKEAADRVHAALEKTYKEKLHLTRDVGGTSGTSEFADAVIANMEHVAVATGD